MLFRSHEAPPFFKAHVDPEVCSDLVINGMKFFRADAPRLFADMLRLAKEGITIYPKSVYARQSSQNRKR